MAECTSSTATAARSSASVSGGGAPAARKTSSGRSRLPPAGDRRPGVARRAARPWPPASSARRSSSRASSRTAGSPAGVDDRLDRRLAQRSSAGTVPHVQGDDPPGGQPSSRPSRSPPSYSIAASSSGPGKAAHRVGQVRHRPRGRRPAVRAPARCGRTTRRSSVDSGGWVGVVISSTTTRPPGRTTRAISARPRSQVGEVACAEADRGGGELVVGVGQRQRVGGLEAQRDAAGERTRALARGEVEHRSRRSRRRRPRRPGPTRRASSKARSPVPVATSSARSPGATAARSAARWRQRRSRPAVMTAFMRS